MTFSLTTASLRRALADIACRDRDVAQALDRVGYPRERRSGRPSYPHLLRILVSQQISTAAAASVYGRLEELLGTITPERFLSLSHKQLCSVGLSRQKISYGRALSEAVASQRLIPEALVQKSDDEVMAAITALKGFGRWSADMFLLFSLGRPDVWPASDLGIQSGLKKLKRLRVRPSPARTEHLAQAWRPRRSAMAIFVWHYHARTPS